MTRRHRIRLIPSIATGLWLFSPWNPALAQVDEEPRVPGADRDQLSFAIDAGSFYSDNLGRTPTDEQSDGAANVGFQLAYRRARGRFTGTVNSNLEYRKYFRDTYGTDVVGGLTGALNYWLLPERFTWAVEENFGQTYTQLAAVETPNNRQNVNYFSTGPDFYLPITERTEVRGQARWAKASYSQADDTDSHRFTGTLGLARHLSTHSVLSLNGSGEKVEYQDLPDDSSFTRRSAFLNLEAEGARTSLSAQGGWNTVTAPTGDTSSPLANVTLTRKIGSRSTMTFDAGTGITDSAEAFRRDQRISGVIKGNETTPVAPEPYRSDYATVAWNLDAMRNAFTLSADWRRDNGKGNVLVQDRDEVGGQARISRRLTSVLTGGIDGAWRRQKFKSTGVDFDEWSVSPLLDWNLSRNISVTLRYDYFRGSGHADLTSGVRDYTENRVTVAFSFGSRS